ncbi:MAG: hypothetical protein AAB552_02230 [Patescibacteria group bacterium]
MKTPELPWSTSSPVEIDRAGMRNQGAGPSFDEFEHAPAFDGDLF